MIEHQKLDWILEDIEYQMYYIYLFPPSSFNKKEYIFYYAYKKNKPKKETG